MTNQQINAQIERMQRAIRNEVNEDTRREWAIRIVAARRLIARREQEAQAPSPARRPVTNRDRREARRAARRRRVVGGSLVNGGQHVERAETVRSNLGFAADVDR